MKNVFIYLIVLFASTISGYANADENFEKYEIFPIEDLSHLKPFEEYSSLAQDQRIEKIMKNWKKNWVVEVKQGIELPIKPQIEGEFFHLKSQNDDIWISVDKTFYIRLENENFLFSTDLNNWQTADIFFTGRIDLSYSADNDDLHLGFTAEFNKR